MRIVFIAPFPPQKDGLASYTKRFVDELQRRKHEVFVVASAGSVSVEHGGVIARFGMGPVRFWKSYRAIRAKKPDVIHIQYTIPAFGLGSIGMWLLALFCRMTIQARLVVTFHEVKRETALLGLVGLLYYRCITRIPQAMTVHTYEAVDILVNTCGVSRQKIQMIPHPLYAAPKKSQPQASLDERYNLKGKRVILCFGFIHVDKGIDYLVKAFDIMRRSDPELKNTLLVIAGTVRARKGIFKWFERKDHAYEADLRAYIAKHHLKKSVLFTGYVPDAHVPLWFAHAEVAVLPYTNLEQSGVVNQALTWRTPVIASAMGGLKETLDGTNALVPPANAGALANKLAEYLQNPTAAAEVVAQYERIRRPRTIGRVVSQLEKVYES